MLKELVILVLLAGIGYYLYEQGSLSSIQTSLQNTCVMQNGVPICPNIINPPSLQNNTLYFSWNPLPNSNGYILLLYKGTEIGGSPVATFLTNSTHAYLDSFTPNPSLQKGQNYTLEVAGFNGTFVNSSSITAGSAPIVFGVN